MVVFLMQVFHKAVYIYMYIFQPQFKLSLNFHDFYFDLRQYSFQGTCWFHAGHKLRIHKAKVSESLWPSYHKPQLLIHRRRSSGVKGIYSPYKGNIQPKGFWSIPRKRTAARLVGEGGREMENGGWEVRIPLAVDSGTLGHLTNFY